MKITEVEALCLRGTGRQGAYGAPYGAVVRISTDAGITGYGESDSMPSVIEAIIEAPYLNELMSGLRALLVGQDPLANEHLWARMSLGTSIYGRDGAARHAMAAIDIALWDIKGKAAGQPIHRLLGGARRDRVRVYATHPLGETLAETARYAGLLRDRGFGAVKFGWLPLGSDERQDEAIVRTLRHTVGDSVDLLIDAGNTWDVATAIGRCRRFEPYRLYWLEEPLAAYDLAGYAELVTRVDTRIAAGELASSFDELTRLVAQGKVPIVQVDVSRVGLTEAMRVAAFARRHGAVCVNHTYTHDINLAASLHFVAAIEQTSLFEYQATPNEIRDALVRNRPRVEDGMMRIPEEPGLGVEIDPAALARFTVRG